MSNSRDFHRLLGLLDRLSHGSLDLTEGVHYEDEQEVAHAIWWRRVSRRRPCQITGHGDEEMWVGGAGIDEQTVACARTISVRVGHAPRHDAPEVIHQPHRLPRRPTCQRRPQRGPRRRGAGRPRAQAARSSARSGDSGDDSGSDEPGGGSSPRPSRPLVSAGRTA